jgi:hypothetical protein
MTIESFLSKGGNKEKPPAIKKTWFLQRDVKPDLKVVDDKDYGFFDMAFACNKDQPKTDCL